LEGIDFGTKTNRVDFGGGLGLDTNVSLY